MKRHFLFAIAAVVFSGFVASCDDDDKDDLRSGIEDSINWHSIAITVHSDDWKYHTGRNNANGYYYADVKVDKLTRAICDGGMVCCYIYNDDYQSPLPNIRYYNSGNEEWTKTIDYEFYRKGVTFYVTDSHNIDELPEKMEFRLAFIY